LQSKQFKKKDVTMIRKQVLGLLFFMFYNIFLTLQTFATTFDKKTLN